MQCREQNKTWDTYFLKPTSKMSFGPISLLEPRFKSSTYNSMPPVYDPPKYDKIDGKSRNAGKLGPAAILNQNPIFEMGFNKKRGQAAACPLFARW
jgi:hypothetical protein